MGVVGCVLSCEGGRSLVVVRRLAVGGRRRDAVDRAGRCLSVRVARYWVSERASRRGPVQKKPRLGEDVPNAATSWKPRAPRSGARVRCYVLFAVASRRCPM